MTKIKGFTIKEKNGSSPAIPMWAVALLALGPAVAQGWARFGYGFLLPPMQSYLNWSYAQAGAMNTAEALGYLVGALLANPIGRYFGLHRTFSRGIAVVVIGLIGCTFTQTFSLLLILRFTAGFGAAAIFISGASLVAAGSDDQRRASVSLTIYTAGVGFGIVVAALLIPYVLSVWGPGGWRWGWTVLAGLSFLSLGLVQTGLKYFPEVAQPKRNKWVELSPLKKLIPITLGYGLCGMGYVGYMTFFIAFLHQHGISNMEVPIIWVVLGSAVVAASFGWGYIFHRLRGGQGLAVVLSILITGVLLPLISATMLSFVISALIVGSSVLAVPPAVFHQARKTLDSEHWTGAIAALTVCFGIGQTLGPVLIGTVSDLGGSISTGIIFSAGILLLALIVSLFQRESTEETEKCKAEVVNHVATCCSK